MDLYFYHRLNSNNYDRSCLCRFIEGGICFDGKILVEYEREMK